MEFGNRSFLKLVISAMICLTALPALNAWSLDIDRALNLQCNDSDSGFQLKAKLDHVGLIQGSEEYHRYSVQGPMTITSRNRSPSSIGFKDSSYYYLSGEKVEKASLDKQLLKLTEISNSGDIENLSVMLGASPKAKIQFRGKRYQLSCRWDFAE